MRRALAAGVLVVGWACLLGGGRLGAQGVAAKKAAAPAKEWTWKDRYGKVRTRAELDEILRLSKEWNSAGRGRLFEMDIPFFGPTPTRQETCALFDHRASTKLPGRGEFTADLRGANLNHADLRSADLRCANLEGAILYYADLKGADLTYADGYQMQLNQADVSGANLLGADLTEVNFMGTNLTGASLTLANLRGANIFDTDLTGSNIDAAFSGTNYEPKTMPALYTIAESKGLDELDWTLSPAPLMSLRKSLQDANFEHQGKLVTASLRKHEESWIEDLLFDWTCDWGADWLHPLELLGWFGLVWTVIYWIGLHLCRKGGLYVVSTGQRVVTSRGREHWRRVWVARPRRLSRRQLRWLGPLPARRWRTWKIAVDVWVRRWIVAEIEALGTAFLFSMMAALNLGFHDFNFGRWIRMLQPREFDLRARGWMRVAAGVQSLIGLYLVALSLLSYFGHPFD